MATSLGHDPSDYNVNRSSIHRQREKYRSIKFHQLKSEFHSKGPLIVHWDGKLLEDLTLKEYVDRLPVLISGCGTEQLLGVPKLLRGTAVAQVDAIVQCLNEWDVNDDVKGICFDTTATNIGIHGGTCTILEQTLGRNLLHFACRHHIMELLLQSAFAASLGQESAGPDILLFKRFRNYWANIDKQQFQTADTDTFTKSAIAGQREKLIQFGRFQVTQARDDYQEFLDLCIIFLGGVPNKGIRFWAPGAMHRARWMSKAICLFSVLIYMKAWVTATLPIEAPLNDLQLMRDLILYPNKEISESTSKKLSSHTWYLSGETVGLAFFDERISVEVKSRMTAALEQEAPDRMEKRPVVHQSLFLNNSKGIEQLVTKHARNFFSNLQLPDGFLAHHPSLWKSNTEYQQARDIFS